MPNRLTALDTPSSTDLSSLVGAPPGSNGHHRNGNGTLSKGDRAVIEKWLGAQFNSYISSLSSTGFPASTRARDPFMSHPWIYAAAVATVMVASQAQLKVYKETGRARESRILEAKRFGRSWTGPKAGRGRRAFERHLNDDALKRFFWKHNGLEEDLEHPLMELLRRPNPCQDEGQFQQFTDLLLILSGECFWVLTGENERRIGPGDMPAEIWPYGPDYFTPVLQFGSRGRLIAWDFNPPAWSPTLHRIRLDLHEVVHFKLPNPANPIRGAAPTAAVALQIETDLAISAAQRKLLANNSVPRSVLKYVGEGDASETELADRKQQVTEEHGGEQQVGGMLCLPKGWELQTVGLPPREMGDVEIQKENRTAELAVMGVPGSVLGLVDFKTYATQLGQDKNFWDKRIIPLNRAKERTIDATLLAPETDDTFCAYDYKAVEAMRAGLEHKMSIAKGLCGQELHMPPERAYELVDLPVEKYPASDQCLVSPMLATAGDVAEASAEISAPAAPQPPKPGEGDEDQGVKPPVDPDQEPPSTPADGEEPEAKGRAPGAIIRVNRIERAKGRWKDFLVVQTAVENSLKKPYRAWVERARKDVLRNFDAATGKKADAIDLGSVLPDPEEWANWLKGMARPSHLAALNATWNLTVSELGGIPSFEIDDDRIVAFFDRREKFFAGQTTQTLIRKVRRSLEVGQASGETIQEMRIRLGQVMDVAAGSAKTLTVARTESAGFMNGTRDEMFAAQGFPGTEWTTAGDGEVRDDHDTFGAAGPKARGFNWLTLVGGSGTLRYPGDMEGPPGQVINCRCTSAPSDEVGKSGRSHGHAATPAAAVRSAMKFAVEKVVREILRDANGRIQGEEKFVTYSKLIPASRQPAGSAQDVVRDSKDRVIRIVETYHYDEAAEVQGVQP